MSKRLDVKYPLLMSEFNETLNFLDRFSKKKKSLNIKFHKNPSSGRLVVQCSHTDGRT
jgi:hypothetical protein